MEKCLEMFAEFAERKPEEYGARYTLIGEGLILRVLEDPLCRSKIGELLRF